MLVKRPLLASFSALLLAGAAAGVASGTAPALAAVSPAAGGRAPSSTGAITKLLVILEENENASAITPSSAPYISGLSARYAHASNYRSVGFPSLPNYLAIAGGSTFGITRDGPPSQLAVNAPSVFGQALKAGRTAKVYSESATTACDTNGRFPYAVRHNPWLYFRPEHAQCAKYDLGFPSATGGALAADVRNGTLPNVGFVDPNITDDGHTPGGKAGLANADRWLSKVIPMIRSGPDWRAGRLAVVITWDSGAAKSTPAVDLIVVAPTVSHLTVTTPLDHYSLSRLMSDFGGSAPRGQAKTATDMRGLFRLQAAASPVTGLTATARYTNLSAAWNASSGATGYQVTVTRHRGAVTVASAAVTRTSDHLGHLTEDTGYAIHVLALPATPGQQPVTAYVTTQ